MRFSRFFWGLAFILAAAWLAASQVFDLRIGVSPWRIIAGIAFAYVFFESLRTQSIFGILVSLAALYWLFAGYFSVYRLPLVPLFGAVALLGIGLYILFGFGGRRRGSDNASEYGIGKSEVTDTDGNFVYRRASCCKSEVYLHAKNLKKGEFICFAGDMHVYFSDAQMDPEGAVIILDCSMGSLKLYVPRSWRVNEELKVSFGSVREKNKYNRNEGPLLLVTGFVRMGSVEIIYL
ncbi:MAG: hypothetical protein FWH38_04405 [Treponema sp.]|nr:hypothetical protein [Treponema sp.]